MGVACVTDEAFFVIGPTFLTEAKPVRRVILVGVETEE
jgi:hypothetical protein